MPDTTTAAWPPPPDRQSLNELLATADVEGFIAQGDPPDEYETEAEQLYNAVRNWPTRELIAERILPVLETIWTQAFSLDDREIQNRRVKLRQLAAQIQRFFGPGAEPHVRGE